MMLIEKGEPYILTPRPVIVSSPDGLVFIGVKKSSYRLKTRLYLDTSILLSFLFSYF